MKVSLCSTPMGSVGISELPPSVTTVWTSGNFFSAFSTMVCVAMADSSEMPGSLVVVTVSAPSSRRGRNSAPRFEPIASALPSIMVATRIVMAGWRIVLASTGA